MLNLFNKNRRDYLGGMLLLLIGLGAALQGWSYRTGSLVEMGPGFFPMALGVILALCGVALLVASGLSAPVPGEEKKLPRQWVAWLHILAAIAAFVILGRFGGLVPATFAVVFISAIGDRDNSFKGALLLAVCMSVVSVLVFRLGLQLQFPLFAWGNL
ncbi:tripartite tricarboxylate transporter TctB family protein [Paraburkholderia phymatum]|uniref:tripartite tricarboxylate transporter TctB family protein n=1 Tax=Paraburkholderia phymatum TaxID=148447 RepID=UPI00317A9155